VVAAPPTANLPAMDNGAANVVSANPAVSTAASTNLVTTVVAPGPAVATAALAVAAGNVVRLALRPKADCWTEVYDVEGRQLFFDIAKRGAQQSVSGKGPLKLVLGNAPVMRIEMGGKELPIAAELQRKGTAFITIAADGSMVAAR
jgi:hypothetical protein